MENKPTLDDIYQEYKASFPLKKQALEAALQTFSDAPGDKTIEHLHRLAHKLSGSAGAYGYEELARLSIHAQSMCALEVWQSQEVSAIIEAFQELITQLDAESTST